MPYSEVEKSIIYIRLLKRVNLFGATIITAEHIGIQAVIA